MDSNNYFHIMDEYIISYRVYGPSNITSHGSVGGASVHPKSDKSEVNATLDFYVEANDKQETTQIQSDLQNEAQHIANVLSFIVRDRLVLVKPYPPTRVDSDFRTQTDYTTVVDDLVLEIGDRMLEYVSGNLYDNNMTERAFTWYNLGLSTETPEDRFVAFWTGLEASVKPMKDLSEEVHSKWNDNSEKDGNCTGAKHLLN